MKIAVTCDGNEVFQHFGRTPEFCIYTVEAGKVAGMEKMQTPAEGHGALVGFLKEHGVNVLICGGIGGGAVNRLREAGIAIYAGASGDVEQQVKSYLTGQLQPTDSAECGEHAHGHSCGDHHPHDHEHGCNEHNSQETHSHKHHGCGHEKE